MSSFERFLRRLVQKHCNNVTTIQGSVTGLTVSADGSTLTSISVRKGNAMEDTSVELAFFVDCTGQSSAATKWLSRIRPEWRDIRRDSYSPSVNYSTATVRLSPEVKTKFESVIPASMRDIPYVRQVYGSMKSGCPYGYGIARGDNDTGKKKLVLRANTSVADVYVSAHRVYEVG
jgi:hypothetical protein